MEHQSEIAVHAAAYEVDPDQGADPGTGHPRLRVLLPVRASTWSAVLKPA